MTRVIRVQSSAVYPGRPRLRPMIDSHHKNLEARRLFDGIAGRYEEPARAFSLFQYDRWRRFLVSRLELDADASVLDVCTGTGVVAIDIARRTGCQVIGLDLSDRMIEQAHRNLTRPDLASLVSLVKGRAETMPFSDRSFDAVVFTFLLRYVEDTSETLQELVRVLRPGGQMASLEFFVPRNTLIHGLWLLHTRLVIPAGTRFISPGWRAVGSFLGPNISAFYRKHTLENLIQMWTDAGMSNVQTRVLSLGGAVVMWGRKEDRVES